MKKLFYIFACCFFVSTVSCEDKSKFLENKPNSNNNNSDTETSAPIKINGHEAIDLGLPSGLLWATCNVGASSPDKIGNYYAWGEVKTKTTFSESNYLLIANKNNGIVHYTKYITSSTYGTIDNKTVLDSSDDVASVVWGGTWRMPTSKDFEELISKCTWKDDYTNQRVICTGPNGKCIYFPDCGFYKNSELINANCIYMWTSSLYIYDGYASAFEEFGRTEIYYENRYYGLTVRPVSKK